MRPLLILPLLAGCVASDYRPPVDPSESVAQGQHYEQDLSHCQQLASQNDPTNQAMANAVAGAFLGAAVSAIHNGSDKQITRAALRGALRGYDAAPVGGGIQWQNHFIADCMTRLGYDIEGFLTYAKLSKSMIEPFMIQQKTDAKPVKCRIGYEVGYVTSESACRTVSGTVVHY